MESASAHFSFSVFKNKSSQVHLLDNSFGAMQSTTQASKLNSKKKKKKNKEENSRMQTSRKVFSGKNPNVHSNYERKIISRQDMPKPGIFCSHLMHLYSFICWASSTKSIYSIQFLNCSNGMYRTKLSCIRMSVSLFHLSPFSFLCEQNQLVECMTLSVFRFLPCWKMKHSWPK